jgi:glycosyltransferase involved in cell wall biosynthesis
MGLHRAVLGIGQGARLFQNALTEGGIDGRAWDISGLFGNDQSLPAPHENLDGVRTVVAHLNPLEHVQALALARGPRPRRGFRAGYWAWETSEVPAAWIRGLAAVDEIWCPSRFTAEAVERLVRGARPVRVVPHPLSRRPFLKADKPRFGLAEEKVVLFAAGDLKSSLARKNPLGAIEAFRRSGCGLRGEAELLVKVHGPETDNGLAELAEAAASTPGVKLLNAKLNASDMQVLQSSVDVVLSPHRSEGYGLILAEAMQAGKPVIATRWSGNLDFMDDVSAALIDASEVPVEDPYGTYKGGVWAEPNLDHAAALIQALVGDVEERERLGVAGAKRIKSHAGLEVWLPQVKPLLGL